MSINIYEPFIKSIKENFKVMAKIDVNFEKSFSEDKEELNSLGVSSVITCSGNMNGRIMLDMEPMVALIITQNITESQFEDVRDPMVLATVSELNNIISGMAISELNDKMGLKLWMAPPYVFSGKNAIICIPKISSASLFCSTKYGQIKINVAFSKGV